MTDERAAALSNHHWHLLITTGILSLPRTAAPFPLLAADSESFNQFICIIPMGGSSGGP